jgi:aminoglycoside 3-N-acetyltransferase
MASPSFLSRLATRCFTAGQKLQVKRIINAIRRALVAIHASYTPDDLRNRLSSMGLAPGDTVILHCSFSETNGFTGGPQQVIESLLALLGPAGNLMMMSMPYTGAAMTYLKSGSVFDVRTTPSRMGLLTEIFRRKRGVRRSLNPVHPVLVYGPKAEWLVEGHHLLSYSCGEGSPFEKALSLNAKILFYDADYLTCTFQHHLEHRIRESFGLRVYHPEMMETTLRDAEGRRFTLKTHVFDPTTVRQRDHVWMVLKDHLIERQQLTNAKIGNTTLGLTSTRAMAELTDELVAARRLPHMKPQPSSTTMSPAA